MYNFNSLWSQFGMLVKENTFDKLFDDPDLNLDTVLDHEMVIGEFRNQNSKLMNYLDDKLMSTLIDYIIKLPPEDASEKRCYRYPFYSSELLCCEIPKIVDSFFPKDEEFIQDDQPFPLFNQLCSFVFEEELNPVLAGYFSKVFSSLLRLKPEIMIKEIYKNDQFIDQLLRHIGSRSIAEVLIRIICIEKDQNIEDSYLEKRMFIIDNLIQSLNDEQDFEVPQNVQLIFQEIIGKAYAVVGAGSLIQHIFQTDYFKKINSLIVHPNNQISRSCVNILYNLLHLIYQDHLREQGTDDQSALMIDDSQVIPVLLDNLQSFVEYLDKDEKLMGVTRLKLIETLEIVLRFQQQDDSILIRLQELDLFKILNKLMLQFENNNLFHLHYYRIVCLSIEHRYHPLLINIFETNNLINLMIKCTEDIFNTNKNRKGYLGFITKLAKFIEEICNKLPEMLQYIDTDQWKQFKEQFLKRALIESEIELGGLSREKVEQFEDQNEYHFHKDEIAQKYESFLQGTAQSEAQKIQGIFEQFNIDNNNDSWSNENTEQQGGWGTWGEQTESIETHQQELETENQHHILDQEQVPNIRVISPTKQQEHNYAQEEAEDEYLHFWKIIHDQDLLKTAEDEFDNNF